MLRNLHYLIGISLLLLAAAPCPLKAQTHVFAQLSGSPVNVSGWNLQGQARVGNILFSDNSEIILCPAVGSTSGALFYNQPINLSICSKWIAEFDFRMFDGSGADGIAFCFLDVPPSGFVSGGGIGIPGAANGLKVCFDQYLNCSGSQSDVPKIEIRWGAGYDECWAQPTLLNSGGQLNFIRSAAYNRAKIVYNAGNIDVYVNNTLYLSGFQEFNFTGYMGFTSSTGGLTDNHSIRNVSIYTEMPPSEAGRDTSVCSGSTVQLGGPSNPAYVYNWSPVQGLSAASVSAPTVTLVNTSGAPQTLWYYVRTGFATNPGCASIDSVALTVLPQPASVVRLNASPGLPACPGSDLQFTATVQPSPVNAAYAWKRNGAPAGENSPVYAPGALNTGDRISCTVTLTDGPCSGIFYSDTLTISYLNYQPALQISPATAAPCEGDSIRFQAQATDGGATPRYQWWLNGQAVGDGSSNYLLTAPASGDRVQCELVSSLPCTLPVMSNAVTVTVKPKAFSQHIITRCAGSTYWGYSATGTYRDTLVAANGCDSIRELQLTLLPLASSSLAQTLCEGTSFLGYSATGTYRDTLVAANGCDSIRTLTLTVIPRIRTVINRSICEGQSLEGYTASGTYVDTLLSASGCDSIRTLNLTVQPRRFSTLSQAICNGQSYLGYSLAGTYVDTLQSVTGCDSIRTLILTVKPLASSLVSQTICAGSAVEGYTQTGTYVDTFTAANGCDSIRTLRLTVLPQGRSLLRESICKGQQFLGYTETGTYMDTLVAFNGCDSIRTLELNVITAVQPALGADTTLCPGTTLLLQPGRFAAYRWSDGSEGPSLLVRAPGDYAVRVTDQCVDTTVSIRVAYEDCYTFFPSAFSPDGDGRNDRFRILTTFAVTRFQLAIYNRWGEQVYLSGDPAQGWDGWQKGKAAPAGAYAYHCSYYRNNRFFQHRGTLVLLR